MKLEQFKIVMDLIDKADKRNDILYKNGIDSIEYSDLYHGIITELFKEIFTDEGWDWIAYYLYEIPMFRGVFSDGKDYYATEEDGTPIYLRNVEELYSYLQKCGYVKS